MLEVATKIQRQVVVLCDFGQIAQGLRNKLTNAFRARQAIAQPVKSSQ